MNMMNSHKLLHDSVSSWMHRVYSIQVLSAVYVWESPDVHLMQKRYVGLCVIVRDDKSNVMAALAI